jgi:glycosyltransferase involved in cell wall biosynthesis
MCSVRNTSNRTFLSAGVQTESRAESNHMRILMMSYEFPPVGGGGAAVVAGLSRQLVASGHEVDLVTMGWRESPRFEVVDGVNVHRVPCVRRAKSACSIAEACTYVVSALPFVRRLVAESQFDLVHAHFILPDGLLAWRLRRATGIRYIITAHGSDVPGYNPHRLKLAHRLLRPLWRAVVRGASRVVCPSAVLERLVTAQRTAPWTTMIIPNGLSVGEYQPRGEAPMVLVVTRMLERKDIQHLLTALAQSPIDAEVNIVGDGPYYRTLRRQAEALRSPAVFWGWLDNRSPALKELYERSTIFVFPSEAENFPVVLLEAMAAGLAIITTEGTGCAEVVGDTALLVPPRDPPAISRALHRLINEPGLRRRLGAAARRRVEEQFTWPAVAQRYVEEYAQHLAQPSATPCLAGARAWRRDAHSRTASG